MNPTITDILIAWISVEGEGGHARVPNFKFIWESYILGFATCVNEDILYTFVIFNILYTLDKDKLGIFILHKFGKEK
jgi:hypothetical protein